jgi:hypothetical protein
MHKGLLEMYTSPILLGPLGIFVGTLDEIEQTIRILIGLATLAYITFRAIRAWGNRNEKG